MVDYMNKKPNWSASISDKRGDVVYESNRPTDGKLSEVTYDNVMTGALEGKKQAIEAKKEAYVSLMSEIQSNIDSDKKSFEKNNLHWRKGKVGTEELGDFIRENIMTGPYATRHEMDKMPGMIDCNDKTSAMYERYFAARDSKKGLDSDPAVKAWVKAGDDKAKAIVDQMSNGTHTSSFDDRAHMAHLNGQRGR